MVKESIPKSTYSMGELVAAVNKQEQGLFQIPNSELTVADARFFDLLDVEHQANEKVLVLSSLEHEQDYFIVGSNVVKWTDNWSGEDERIYEGNVQDDFEISFEGEVFKVNSKNLELVIKNNQLKAPVVQIDMGTVNEQTNKANSQELNQ
ncbi:hypothetical protein [Enterococcus pallens]|uniref:Uncharacterized protein n=1 Tax=Enterococcus pallens ATCC BAA-351 TaxID=1158607 RepID=R2RSJ6_9ENTE|nr:hypothetical protein [Enterococcus pallens]EOH86330.1 hypothetical protein UAU_05252 [Enterococcus pallens ATCC BAA-351]EOU09449.1 hypothetical protein I588_05182 [Enterococcus pallens ATCC BAA-351]OJG77554.1 hypothetical protein RV10_GL002388 [Enterococcus pallens]